MNGRLVPSLTSPPLYTSHTSPLPLIHFIPLLPLYISSHTSPPLYISYLSSPTGRGTATHIGLVRGRIIFFVEIQFSYFSILKICTTPGGESHSQAGFTFFVLFLCFWIGKPFSFFVLFIFFLVFLHLAAFDCNQDWFGLLADFPFLCFSKNEGVCFENFPLRSLNKSLGLHFITFWRGFCDILS